MEDNTPNQNMPLLCRKGCGFYGSPNFDGFCSKCHRDAEQQKQQELKQTENQSRSSEKDLAPLGEKEKKVVDDCVKSAVDTFVASASVPSPLSESVVNDKSSEIINDVAPSPSSASDKDAASTPTSATDNLDTESSHSSTNSTPKPKKNRCFTCKKKVGLTGFDCRCGGVYCSTHRYSDMHSCAFDYRESGQEEIRRANPHIISSKVQKI